MSLSELIKLVRHERWVKEGLVGKFKLALYGEGITIEEQEGNSFLAKRGEIKVFMSAHESSPDKPGIEAKGWWGVQHSFVEKGEGSGLPWGVVFLYGHIEGGFWVDGLDFFEVVKGSLDSQGGHNIYLRRLEEVPDLAKRFHTVMEFLRMNGLLEEHTSE